MTESVIAAINYIKETVTRDRFSPLVVSHIEVLINHVETHNADTLTELNELIQAVMSHNERLEAVLDKIPSGVDYETKQATKQDTKQDSKQAATQTSRKESMRAYFNLEDWIYSNGGKDKPIEVKSAMVWGGLWVLKEQGCIDWNTMREMYGEFMSKVMSLR